MLRADEPRTPTRFPALRFRTISPLVIRFFTIVGARRLRRVFLFALALAASGLAHGGAWAQTATRPVRPWIPPAVDSLVAWAAEARARFQTQKGDSATGPNQYAFDLVGKAGRRLLMSVGRGNWIQAPAMKQVLDSLQLDTDVVIDASNPAFVLMMVRNPFHPAWNGVGYLYWYKDETLRYQGVVFNGAAAPRIRVWWTSRNEAPYEWGILSREHDPAGWWQLVLLRLNPNGLYWNLAQYEGNGPDLGAGGQVYWSDLNGDERPEIVSWVRAQADSGFEECLGCPGLVSERVFTERERGFELHDSRVLPSPYSTFILFIHLLREKSRAGAARLLMTPAKLDQAIALGWADKTPWKLEYAEPDQPWPRWLAMRRGTSESGRLYIVHFTLKDGRWVIRDWLEPKTAGQKPATPESGQH